MQNCVLVQNVSTWNVDLCSSWQNGFVPPTLPSYSTGFSGSCDELVQTTWIHLPCGFAIFQLWNVFKKNRYIEFVNLISAYIFAHTHTLYVYIYVYIYMCVLYIQYIHTCILITNGWWVLSYCCWMAHNQYIANILGFLCSDIPKNFKYSQSKKKWEYWIWNSMVEEITYLIKRRYLVILR